MARIHGTKREDHVVENDGWRLPSFSTIGILDRAAVPGFAFVVCPMRLGEHRTAGSHHVAGRGYADDFEVVAVCSGSDVVTGVGQGNAVELVNRQRFGPVEMGRRV